MSQSASSGRGRRRAAAAKAAQFARRRTISDGLASFTIEDICEAADFSRRTFFNYFASKEDDAFVDARGDVLDDLVALAVARWARHAVSLHDAADVGAAIEREPRLITRMFAHIHDTERATTALIERREGYEAGDPRASTTALLFGALMRMAFDDFFSHPDGPAFDAVLRARIAVARSLFA
jgi:AcrR family transcriptional regulator